MGTLTWRPTWCFSKRADYEPAPGFTISLPFISHNTITLHKQLHIQSPEPQLSTVHYTDTRPTRNVVCLSGAWFENRPHSTPSIRLARNPKRVKVQWVGVRTNKQKIIISGLLTMNLNAQNFFKTHFKGLEFYWIFKFPYELSFFLFFYFFIALRRPWK